MRSDPKSKSSRKVAFASFVGTAVEWYDFYLYGTAAALIFNKLFFPKFDPMMGVMAAFATYSVGFFARPVGGAIFGHFGDRISRKTMLVVTLSLMGISTALIGVLPTYNSIGVIAPLLLVLLRFIQGFAVGGEWGGAVVMAAEHSREKERGFYASWPNAGAPFGLVLSIIVFLIFSSMPQEQFMSWGWRMPFLLGILIMGVGLWIRLNMLESPVFMEKKEYQQLAKIPALEMIHKSGKNFLLAMGVRFVESASYYIFTVFVLSFSTEQLHLSKEPILYAVMTASILETITIPLFGQLSDKLGRRPVYLAGAVLVGLFAFPFFWLIQSKNVYIIGFAIAYGTAICHAAMHGPQASFISELFKTRFRYSGAGIAYHLSSALSGGVAPLIATGLVILAKGNSWPVSIYIILMAIITIISVIVAKETVQEDISK